MHHSRKKPHQHLGSNSKCHAFSTASSSGSLRSFFRALGFIGSISCASVGIAQDAPLITITKSDKIAIGLNGIGGPDGATLLQLVQKDLQLSGAFSIGAPRTGNFQVGGNVSGSSLNGSLTDRSGKSVLSRSYSGSIRAQAHAFAQAHSFAQVRVLSGSPLGTRSRGFGLLPRPTTLNDGEQRLFKKLNFDGSVSDKV